MRCARLQLQERKVTTAARTHASGFHTKPSKFCQRRLIDPAHDDDPRWTNIYERFYCQAPEVINETPNKVEQHHPQFEDMYLSVQNLKFQGNEMQKKRQRSGFKLKKVDDRNIHRMFVKQSVMIDNLEPSEDDRSSQLTCYYYDDCAKYLQNYGRPFSSRSNYSLPEMKSKHRENKATQVELTNSYNHKKKLSRGNNINSNKRHLLKNSKISDQVDRGTSSFLNDVESDTKVCFHRTDNKKSLTIARAQSPESVQVIRVDVVCAHAVAAPATSASPLIDTSSKSNQIMEKIDVKNSLYAKKYLVSNTIKNLEERVAGGSKVTLLCKTFKLSDRFNQSNKQKTLSSKLQLKK